LKVAFLRVSLYDATAFEVISYIWGVKPPHIPLKVNCCELRVTSAFEELLFYQRSILGPKLFWIDAICIDQGSCIDWDILINAMQRLGRDGDLMRRLHFYTGVSRSEDGKLYAASRKVLHVPKVEHPRWTQLGTLASARRLREGNIPTSLAVMLLITVVFKSTNPRDRIFALLGIVIDGYKLPFQPDYNMDVCEIFLKTTAYVFSTEEWFRLFSMTGRGYDSLRSLSLPPSQDSLASQFKDKLPSWVPDYSSDCFAGSRPALTSSIEAADPKGEIIFTPDDKIIQIQAVEFDEIQIVGPREEIGNRTKYLQLSFASGNWYSACKRLIHDSQALAHKPEETRDREFWALCMCQKENENVGPEPEHLPVLSVAAQKLFEGFLSAPDETLNKARSDVGFDPEFQMIMYLERRFSYSVGLKAFYITAEGKMALMPPLVRSGDTLVHVRGGYMPIVLRRAAAGERRAELVGACIVQDVKDVYSRTGWEDWLLE
jgi:hypothetical protein